MSDEARRIAAAEEQVRRFSAGFKAVQLYAADHPIVTRATELLVEHLERALIEAPEVVMGLVDRELVVDGIPLAAGAGTRETAERFRAAGIERAAFLRGVTAEEIVAFLRRLAASRAGRDAGSEESIQSLGTAHIRVGTLRLQRRVESQGRGYDISALQGLYLDTVSEAQHLWEQAHADGSPDPSMAQAIVERLAGAVGQNRAAMMAITALCRHDNYTFTHMVNVSVLTMAQARSLGIDGDPLRQFGLAGLMHDIGKIRTPIDILAKPDKLTDEEMAVMKRHPVDGGEILRRHLELPPLAAVVAFEHHLRIDGTGYPAGVRRPALNVATQLCSIADVYDAMRSQRKYQQAFPTDRILAVLQQSDGARFERHLVRRFSQLMGIYPPGTTLRLDSGAIAVVVQAHAPDPARPAVRVVVSPDGRKLLSPIDLALWADDSPDGPPPRVVSPVDPREYDIDPLAVLGTTEA